MSACGSIHHRRFALLSLAATLLSYTAAFSQADAQTSDGLSAAVALEQALTQVIEQSEPSVVAVARIRIAADELGLDGGGLQRHSNLSERLVEHLPNQFATGVILAPPNSDERFVLTAYHAVRGAPVYGVPGSGDGSRLEIRLPTRHLLGASLWAADPRSDLAVLKIELQETGLRPSDLRPIPWTSAPAVRKGQLVLVLGNPYWIARDGSASAGWGMVSNLARRPAALVNEPVGPQTLQGLGGLIHVDYRLPIGTSGAPVLNLRGELVGLASSLASIEGYERSGGFATPIDPTTRWIVQSLLDGYEVEYGYLGIRPESVQRLPASVVMRRPQQPSAARVQLVGEGSPAQKADLRTNDIILAVDGEPTLTDLDLMRQVTLHPPGTPLRLSIYRPQTTEELTLTVNLGKWPVSDAQGVVASRRRYPLWRGLAVDYSSARHNAVAGDPRVLAAVLVTEVAPNSPAQAALLEPGVFITHVNRQAVRTPAAFAEAVRGARGPVTLTLYDPEGKPKSVVVSE